MFDEQQPENGFNWRRMPSPVDSVRKAPGQVGFDLLEELIILEQDIELFEHRVGLPRQFRYPRKDIFWRVAINEHRHSLLSKLLWRFYRFVCSRDKLNQLKPLLIPAARSVGSTASANPQDDLALELLERPISHRKLVLVSAAK